MSSLCDGIGATGLEWGMRGEDIEHNPRKQHERINKIRIISSSTAFPSSYKCGVGDGSNVGDGKNIAVLLNLLSATAANDDDDDKDDRATSASSDVNFDGGDAAQFAHIIRQEVTRVQVLSQFQLCQSGKQQ